jgi:hypothetical protein
VRHFFHERSLRRRAIALVAAYTIALASLLASFTAARATIDTNNSLGVICHTLDTGQTNPAGGQDNGKACAENCCIGCLMLTAALPPPPINITNAPQTLGEPLPLPETTALAGSSFTKSYRSRAPPLTA